MTDVTAMPTSDTWTVDDVDALPDDGLRYELVDGTLLVTPAPSLLHQRAVFRVARALDDACPDDLEVFIAPADFRPSSRRSLQPDVLVVRRGDIGERAFSRPPLLVVEVLSPGTRVRDLTLKREVYAQSGVPSYWLLDPEVPSLTVLALVGDAYEEVAAVSGDADLAVGDPFGVRVAPRRSCTERCAPRREHPAAPPDHER